ncbi:serine/threonine-protein kinase [Actinoplanes sp. NPDC051494]|uniref:serine/threonine-protein kinase n=1 Tax=Actinoplanes sp. NPDC051494 TaxID=3363907 RepID=UPI00378B9653
MDGPGAPVAGADAPGGRADGGWADGGRADGGRADGGRAGGGWAGGGWADGGRADGGWSGEVSAGGDRLRVEARAVGGLRHPNVVEVYEFGEEPGEFGAPATPYVVMELVEGRTLAQVFADGPLPWRTSVRICSQVAAGLAAAHAGGVAHRDVKPGNVMVTSGGVKLLDFGISAPIGSADEQDGEVLGTPAYLAPERLDGGPVRAAADVYGVGLLLYRALAGRMPWQASTVTEMVRAHLYAEPPALPVIEGLPPVVSALLQDCLAKRPHQRPAAAEVARILEDSLRPVSARLSSSRRHFRRERRKVPSR